MQANKTSTPEDQCLQRPGYSWQNDSCSPPPLGFIDPAACKAINAAVWDDAGERCTLPKNEARCKAADPSFIWDGDACVTPSKSRSFFQLCNDADISAETRKTINAMMEAYPTADCQAAHDKLKTLTKMSFNKKSISELSPFAGFTALESLDLWDNLIADLTPLSALKNMRILRLGHNKITKLDPITAFSELELLSVPENFIKDASPILKLTKLKHLDIARNKIADLSAFKAASYPSGFFTEGQELSGE